MHALLQVGSRGAFVKDGYYHLPLRVSINPGAIQTIEESQQRRYKFLLDFCQLILEEAGADDDAQNAGEDGEDGEPGACAQQSAPSREPSGRVWTCACASRIRSPGSAVPAQNLCSNVCHRLRTACGERACVQV